MGGDVAGAAEAAFLAFHTREGLWPVWSAAGRAVTQTIFLLCSFWKGKE